MNTLKQLWNILRNPTVLPVDRLTGAVRGGDPYVSIPGFWDRKWSKLDQSKYNSFELSDLKKGSNNIAKTAQKIVEQAERTLAASLIPAFVMTKNRSSTLKQGEQDFKRAVIDLTSYVYADIWIDRDQLEMQLNKYIHQALYLNKLASTKLDSVKHINLTDSAEHAVRHVYRSTEKLLENKQGNYQITNFSGGPNGPVYKDDIQKFLKAFIDNPKESSKNRAQAQVLLHLSLGIPDCNWNINPNVESTTQIPVVTVQALGSERTPNSSPMPPSDENSSLSSNPENIP